MKSVYFKKITVQNFLSVGDDPVCIVFNQGINIITGSNKDKPDRQNAVGKSTIADALYFAIFGETLRELKRDLIINNITGGTSQVCLEFDVDTSGTLNSYKLVRTLNPSKIFLYENDIDITRDTLANTNKFVCDVLSATPNIFQNCVIMTVNNAVPFMAKGKVDKRKFIEDIFGLEIFSNMLSTLRNEYNELRKQYDIENSKVEEVKNSINSYTSQRQKLLDHKTEKLELYKTRQRENVLQKEKLQQQLACLVDINIDDTKIKIEKLNNGLNVCEEKLTDRLSQITELKTKISYLTSNYSKIGTSEHQCPVCLREITDHDLEHIDEEKKKITNEITDLKSKLVDHIKHVEELKTKKETIKNTIKSTEQTIVNQRLQDQTKQNIQNNILQIEKWQESLVVDIEQVSQTNTDFDEIINQTQTRLDELITKTSEYVNKFNILDVVKYVVSEEGVKSYIVNKLLNMLNGKLAYYLSKLDSNAICRFNEFFEEEIVNEKNKLCSYFNFSGAERKSIDLACLFTFSDLRRMQGGVQYNIAIYDELFDSSFDEKGLEHVTEILKERATKFGECIYIISHRKESLKAVTGDVVFLEKQNGITRRVPFTEDLV